MKRLVLIFALGLTFLMSACVKPTEPTGLRFSVLGDSFSSLEGYVDPDTNDPFVNYPDIGVTQPEQMWWHQVATGMGWTMDKNNSFSGSLVCNFKEFDSGDYYGPNSFIRRMDNLGNPDVILVFGATNDIYKRAPLDDYIYSDWTEEQLCTFRPALAYLFENLQRLYPKAEVYFMLDLGLCINDTSIDEGTRQAYIASIHRIASHYNVGCIDLFDIHKSWWHPNAQGQKDIADQVLEYFDADIL